MRLFTRAMAETALIHFNRGERARADQVDFLLKTVSGTVEKRLNKYYYAASLAMIVVVNFTIYFICGCLNVGVDRGLPMEMMASLAPGLHPWLTMFLALINVVVFGSIGLSQLYKLKDRNSDK